jgi:uncharacterized RDD family membrane protein YckC
LTQQTDVRVSTAEHVRVSYPIAGIGNRFVAAFIDAGLQALLLTSYVIALIALAQLEFFPQSEAAISIYLALAVLGLFLLIWGYYVAFEALWNGQTPGKRLVGIRVIGDDGAPVGGFAVIVRNLVRIIDFLPFPYAIGVLVMLLSPKGQRLGDIVAGTIVVKARAERDFQALRTRATAPVATLTVRALPGEAQRIVREFALREGSLSENARSALARSLARRIRPFVPESAEHRDDLVFLRLVAGSLRAQGAGSLDSPRSAERKEGI